MKDRFAGMHNDYLDPDRHLNQPETPDWWAKLERTNKTILKEFQAKNWGDVYRRLYKSTNCGVSVGIAFYEGETDVEPGGATPIHNSDLYEKTPDQIAVSVLVSSIIEGVEQTTSTHQVNLMSLAGKAAIKAIYAACDAVEKEAEAIWKQTHGCEKCAELASWVNPETGEECKGNDGCTPVSPKCPECEGSGSII